MEIGQQIGQRIVIAREGKLFRVRCSCGQEAVGRKWSLTETKSCADCGNKNRRLFKVGDLIHEREIIGVADRRGGVLYYQVRCSCGRTAEARAESLTRFKRCKSCCLKIDRTGQTQGEYLVVGSVGEGREGRWRVRNADGEESVMHEGALDLQEYRKKRTNYYLYELIRKRSEVRSGRVEFSLRPSDITVPEHCPIRGNALRMGRGQRGPDSPTAIRMDLKQGWEPGNVAVISWHASKMLAKIQEPRVRLSMLDL